MKKLLFSLTLLIGILVLSSCSNQECAYTHESVVYETLEQSKQLEDLCSKIETYNQTLPSLDTRGKKKWKWWQWAILGASDAIGGAAAGLFGGVSASAVVATAWAAEVDQIVVKVEVEKGGSHPIPYYTGVIIDNNDFKNNYADSIGYIHNRALVELCSDSTKVQEFCAIDSNGKITMITNTLNMVNNTNSFNQSSAEEKNSAFDKAELIRKIANTADDLNDFISLLHENSSILGVTNSEIDVYEKYFTGLANAIETGDNGNYLNDILHFTDQSNLSSNIKRKIGNVIILANASFRLWYNSSFGDRN